MSLARSSTRRRCSAVSEQITSISRKGTPASRATARHALEEARENLRETVAMVLEANRELAEQELHGRPVTREELVLAT